MHIVVDDDIEYGINNKNTIMVVRFILVLFFGR